MASHNPRGSHLPKTPRSPNPFANLPRPPSSPPVPLSRPLHPPSEPEVQQPPPEQPTQSQHNHGHFPNAPHFTYTATSSYFPGTISYHASSSSLILPSSQAPDFAVLDITARLCNDVDAQILLCFHQGWVPDAIEPVILSFSDQSVKRVAGNAKGLLALPRTKIHSPIDLFSIYHSWSTTSSEFESELATDSEDGDYEDDDGKTACKHIHPTTTQPGTPILRNSYTILLTSLLIYLILLTPAVLLIISNLLSHPPTIPLAFHKPLIQTTIILNPTKAPILLALETIKVISQHTATVCEQPDSWARHCKDGIINRHELSDVEFWGDDCENDAHQKWRFVGASKEQMREVVDLCTELKEPLSNLGPEVQHNFNVYLNHAISSLHHILKDLHVNYPWVNTSNITEVTNMYLNALTEQHPRRRKIQERIVRQEIANLAKGHIPRNKDAWELVTRTDNSALTATGVLEELVVYVRDIGPKLEDIKWKWTMLQRKLAMFERAKHLVGFEKTGYGELRPKLLTYTRHLRKAHDQIFALSSTLRYPPWGHPLSQISNYTVKSQWELMWTWLNVGDNVSVPIYRKDGLWYHFWGVVADGLMRITLKMRVTYRLPDEKVVREEVELALGRIERYRMENRASSDWDDI